MNDNHTINIVLCGVGGQGILLASEITARAALAAGHDVKTNEVHGMAQRGGSVIAQVRYGAKVNSPLVEQGTAQVLASLERIEALRYAEYLAPEGLAIVSSQMVVPVTVSSGAAQYPEDAEARLRKCFTRLIYLNPLELAKGLGNPRTANVIVIGAMSVGLTLPEPAWQAAIRQSVKEKYVELNLQAFAAGVTAARQALATA